MSRVYNAVGSWDLIILNGHGEIDNRGVISESPHLVARGLGIFLLVLVLL